MKILIADDDDVSRMVLEATLENLGHEVTAAEDGREALEAFQKERFPVIVSDWRMPKMDGLEFCREVRKSARKDYTCFVLICAPGCHADYAQAIAAGVDDFIAKPVEAEPLATRLLVAQKTVQLHNRLAALEAAASVGAGS